MGAYYEATIGEGENARRFCTHKTGNGLKLMEHSYISNDYCMVIMSMLLNKPQPLVWLCDYHEADDLTSLTWDNVKEFEGYDQTNHFEKSNCYVFNHTKKLFINLGQLHNKGKAENDGWAIHPIPILCNSDERSRGGGDYHPEDSRRATWCGDLIETSKSPRNIGYEDVTEDCWFTE